MTLLERLTEEETKKYVGKWVAVKGTKLLVAADSPKEVSDWLKARGLSADLVYQVPAENDPLNFF